MTFHTPPAAHVEHVKINVSDLNRAIEFYTESLGFSVLDKNDQSASLTTDGETSILSLYQPENAAPKGRTSGLYHFAILLPERSDLAAITLQLANKNIRFGSADHRVSEALYLNDPDGNGIEIYIDRPAEEWNWHNGQVEMTTEPLDFENLLKSFDPVRPWNGMPKDTVMGHLHLHVGDLSAALKFYTEGLGLDIVCDFAGQAMFMSTENYHHHIAVNIWNGPDAPAPDKNGVGLNYYVLRYPDETSRDAAITRLEKIGFDVTHENGKAFSADSSGSRVELAF
ncbi:VOC family protein [Salinicoccus halodurans]|uniref:Catechol 2,3-dioxygenase n=1 Tax=Salinicoccus halodurans TaxID=407035 RepID=A0A0F7HLZ1_9STAP|nr:VOC family protein [Salinicoccus halodurans]AKG74406.1 glyoxalase [Salinicoccus halodurans]SFK95583.1 catechol 2,3-dioxygenase [Salinicoccus halodurans]